MARQAEALSRSALAAKCRSSILTDKASLAARFVEPSWPTVNGNGMTVAVNNTNFEDHDFKQFLVLQIGHDSVVESQLCAAVRKWSGAPAG
jgi:hypothetical protein